MDFITAIDTGILTLINNTLTFPLFQNFWKLCTLIGEFGVLWIAIAIYFIFFTKYRRQGYTIILALFLSFIVSYLIIKPLFQRDRPFQASSLFKLIVSPPSGTSFPSSHACTAFACAYILSKINNKTAICAFTIATLIALSRLFLFVHYPTDVIIGGLIGYGCGYVAYRFMFKGNTKNKTKYYFRN